MSVVEMTGFAIGTMRQVGFASVPKNRTVSICQPPQKKRLPHLNNEKRGLITFGYITPRLFGFSVYFLMKIHLAEALRDTPTVVWLWLALRYAIRVNSAVHFGNRLRAIESSMPLRKLIDSGAE